VREVKYVITDELGIHARPAGLLVKLLGEFAGDVQVGTDAKMVDGKRLLSVMGLGLVQGDELRLVFDGAGEEMAAVAALKFLSESL